MLTDLVQLRTFVAVAEEQHLTRAAERLHISQSTASAHVRAVEESLSTQLFLRANRSLELTSAGKLVLRRARTLLNEAADFNSFVREIRGNLEGTLVVGASSDPSASRIGEVVADLRSRHPLIDVNLKAWPAAGARQALKSGELDACVLLAEPDDAGLSCYRLETVNFRVAGPAAWRERIEQAGWPELSAMPWIIPSDRSPAYSTMLSQLFARKGLELNTNVCFDNAALGLSLVRAGVGMLLLREEHARQGERDGKLALSPIVHAQFDLCVMHVATRGNDPLIRAFVDSASIAWPDMRKIAVPAGG